MCEFKVTQDLAGIRLDRFLAKVMDVSRNQIQKLISGGHVFVAGSVVSDPSRKVKFGEVIKSVLPELKQSEAESENIPIEIIYQDDFFAVINKPRGLAVHPGAGRPSGTLVNALLYHLDGLSGIGGVERPGIVHRLDLDTSGIILIAKNDFAHENLSKQFSERLVKKEYFAIVHGVMLSKKGEIVAPIGRHRVNRKKMSVIEGGRYAHTTWESMEQFDKFSFLKINLMTGRTHQIRVHMEYIKHPIVGDPLYCNKSNPFGTASQLLHAGNISFSHPEDGRTMSFSAALPDDMVTALESLRHFMV